MTSQQKPLLSIICITYNHEKYIEEAIKSFISQKVNFAFEAIIADDCSSDKTQEIIKKYQKQYPRIIKPILRKKNIGCGANFKDTTSRAKGEYIALCEGDDFFTDKNKLQIQVDFMKKNPNCSVCFHQVEFFYEDKMRKNILFPNSKQRFNKNILSYEDLIKGNFIQTNSVIYKNNKEAISKINQIDNNSLPMDWLFHLIFSQYGDICYIDKVMSVYRIHKGGCWYNTYVKSKRNEFITKNGLKIFSAHMDMLKIFKGYLKEIKMVINNHIFHTYLLMRNVDTENKNNNLTDQIIEQFGIYQLLNIVDENRNKNQYIYIIKAKFSFKHRVSNFLNKICGLGKVYKKL